MFSVLMQTKHLRCFFALSQLRAVPGETPAETKKQVLERGWINGKPHLYAYFDNIKMPRESFWLRRGPVQDFSVKGWPYVSFSEQDDFGWMPYPCCICGPMEDSSSEMVPFQDWSTVYAVHDMLSHFPLEARQCFAFPGCFSGAWLFSRFLAREVDGMEEWAKLPEFLRLLFAYFPVFARKLWHAPEVEITMMDWAEKGWVAYVRALTGIEPEDEEASLLAMQKIAHYFPLQLGYCYLNEPIAKDVCTALITREGRKRLDANPDLSGWSPLMMSEEVRLQLVRAGFMNSWKKYRDELRYHALQCEEDVPF